MKLKLTRTAAGLASAVTLAVAVAFAVGAIFYSHLHFGTMVELARRGALGEGELIREALEQQMLDKDRTLITAMVESFGERTDIEGVMILDHAGQVRYSSDPTREGQSLGASSPTCRSCHELTAAERNNSQILEMDDGTLLRVVVPIRNREACHECHDPAAAMNGILVLDTDVGETRQAMNRDLVRMVLGSGLLALLLMGTVAAIVQILLLRRLRRFETTARLIAEGDLDRRVPVSGSDTISWLAREFNTMTDSVTGLVTEVRNQRERLETVINSIDDGIVVLDPERRIIAANSAFLRRTGRGRDEVLGCGCRDVAEGVCTTSDCPTLACLDTGQPQVRICERRDRAGKVAWEEVHSSPIRNSAGEVAQVVEVWRDISERRGAEARLAESHRLASLGQLASGFSHEMSTPLATILTCVEGILREAERGGEGETGDGGSIAGRASIARDQVLRCRGITQHFLRLSRGQGSPGDSVDVASVVRAVTRLVEPTAASRGVEVLVQEAGAVSQVKADEAELQHALMNLLINAMDACEAGGRVTVEVEEDGQVHVRVRDDGEGMAPEQVERIFEPFVSFRDGGTGLGLFLALNFVRRWGGDILVDSGPGRGSTFEIVLPAIETRVVEDSAP